MTPHQKPKKQQSIEDPEVSDITHLYPKRKNQVQDISIKNNRPFNMKQYFADLEALGIPAENIGMSACG